jgi:adenylosuccinate synthase
VLDPSIFKKEIESIRKIGFDISKNLYISKKAHLILPTHRLLDAASESSKGDTKIGSTLKGIGPTYRDKIGREGLRVGDILSNFDEKYNKLKNQHIVLLEELYHFDYKEQLAAFEKEWFEGLEVLKCIHLLTVRYILTRL